MRSTKENQLSLPEYLFKRNRIQLFLEEDIGSADITSELVVPRNLLAQAAVYCKGSSEEIVLCGSDEACIAFEICGCSTNKLLREGTILSSDQQVISVRGEARAILKAERTALNLLMRMSGIATECRRWMQLFRKIGVDTKVTATRKTSPGMRVFDKKAVMIGGGYPHRSKLDEMILIKDNHISIVGSASECIRIVRKRTGKSAKIECEVRSEDELISAVLAGADIVMLDNFTVGAAKSALYKLNELGLRNQVQIEISGGINLSNVHGFAVLKPDFISVGRLTHSSKAADFSMDIKTYE